MFGYPIVEVFSVFCASDQPLLERREDDQPNPSERARHTSSASQLANTTGQILVEIKPFSG